MKMPIMIIISKMMSKMVANWCAGANCGRNDRQILASRDNQLHCSIVMMMMTIFMMIIMMMMTIFMMMIMMMMTIMGCAPFTYDPFTYHPFYLQVVGKRVSFIIIIIGLQ